MHLNKFCLIIIEKRCESWTHSQFYQAKLLFKGRMLVENVSFLQFEQSPSPTAGHLCIPITYRILEL